MKRGYLGIAFVLVATVIILFNSIITGAVIGPSILHPVNLAAIAIFIAGVILLSEENKLERRLKAEKILKSGAAITKSEDLRKIAKQLGYEERLVKEGYEILDRYGRPLTVVPYHKEVERGTSREILKAVVTGESSYQKRRRRYAQT